VAKKWLAALIPVPSQNDSDSVSCAFVSHFLVQDDLVITAMSVKDTVQCRRNQHEVGYGTHGEKRWV